MLHRLVWRTVPPVTENAGIPEIGGQTNQEHFSDPDASRRSCQHLIKLGPVVLQRDSVSPSLTLDQTTRENKNARG